MARMARALARMTRWLALCHDPVSNVKAAEIRNINFYRDEAKDGIKKGTKKQMLEMANKDDENEFISSLMEGENVKRVCLSLFEGPPCQLFLPKNVPEVPQPTISCLPPEMLEKIFLNLSYAEISDKRLVCWYFDKVCQSLLNRGLRHMKHYWNQYMQKVKADLPKNFNIFTTMEIKTMLLAIDHRISLLSLTYSKHFDLCCFIPGKVIDVFYRVLPTLKSTEPQPPGHEIQEFLDISSMAKKHFEEKIVPGLEKSLLETPSQSYSSSVTMVEGSSNNNNVDELLIKRVQIHSEVWNQLSPNYKDASMKENAWKAISQELGLSSEKCKAKWATFRHAYWRAKRAKTNATGDASFCKYEQELSFLQTSVSNTADLNFDVNSNPEQHDNIGSVELEPDNLASGDDSDLKPQRSEKRKLPIQKHKNAKSGRFDTFENVEAVEMKAEAESDADEKILLSFLPILKRFNNQQKAEAKLKINQVLSQIEFPSEE